MTENDPNLGGSDYLDSNTDQSVDDGDSVNQAIVVGHSSYNSQGRGALGRSV